jgi:hypothetical protein
MSTLAEALAELEAQGRGIPDFLHEQGVVGVREDCNACPVAVFLLQRTGAARIDVNGFAVTAYYEDGGTDDEMNHRYVTDFIQDFDTEHYPELDMYPTDESAER